MNSIIEVMLEKYAPHNNEERENDRNWRIRK